VCLAEDPSLDVRVAASGEALAGQEIDVAVVSARAAGRQRFPCSIVVCGDDAEAPPSVARGNDVAGVLVRGSLTVAQLHATVHAAAAGLRVSSLGDGDDGADTLDPRALRLLELMADGHTTREIADRMSYSERTIKKLITGLEDRMQARSRPQIVAQAIRRGLI